MSISDRKNKNLSFFHATCSSELQNVPCICYTLENEYTFFLIFPSFPFIKTAFSALAAKTANSNAGNLIHPDMGH